MKILQKKQQPNRRSANMGEGRATKEQLNARYAFRRNRTLTGSLSSDVESASEHTAELRSGRVEAHYLRRHRRRLALILVGVLVAIGGLGWIIYQSIAGVTVVVDAATPPIDTSSYEHKIQDYLNNHPFERSRSTINVDALTLYLQNNGFPEVAGVKMRSGPSGVGASTMIVTMRQPVVAWKTNASYLYVDSTGVAFSRNFYTAPLVEVVDQTGIQTGNNQVLASSRFLGFIGRIIGQLKNHGYTATQAVLPENTARQLAVSVQEVPYAIKFSADRPAGEQAEDAARAIHHLQGVGYTPAYLDVRVQNKAYYK